MYKNRLKELRINKKLSRNDVAERIGIKSRTYLSYENNEREPNSEMLITLANFFNVSIDYLICRTDKPAPEIKTELKQDEKTLITNYRELNLLGKEKAQEYITDLSEQPKYTSVDEERSE